MNVYINIYIYIGYIRNKTVWLSFLRRREGIVPYNVARQGFRVVLNKKGSIIRQFRHQ